MRWIRFLLAAFPVAMLTVMVPAVNRVDPRIAGLPFLLVWIVGWVMLTPLFLFAVSRLDRRV